MSVPVSTSIASKQASSAQGSEEAVQVVASFSRVPQKDAKRLAGAMS
ncbi:hypothetical protein MUN88_17490 [Gracilibacillus caseinilyticus]|uniref:Uncharacterized protein n=1 Tax=Gracilibacillus caseinilyticus TaxID=2932256 RepID=A0ABY4EV22_9BACI|nr:hypothetical protein [Gracilibacillus caseinilyticus]UOQ47825.1 hypothetical protein MUN88_17490 [Gracilibacillus caseinilyticus]